MMAEARQSNYGRFLWGDELYRRLPTRNIVGDRCRYGQSQSKTILRIFPNDGDHVTHLLDFLSKP